MSSAVQVPIYRQGGALVGWCVLVQVHRVRHHGGRFATEEAAARAASDLRQRLMPFSNEARAA